MQPTVRADAVQWQPSHVPRLQRRQEPYRARRVPPSPLRRAGSPCRVALAGATGTLRRSRCNDTFALGHIQLSGALHPHAGARRSGEGRRQHHRQLCRRRRDAARMTNPFAICLLLILAIPAAPAAGQGDARRPFPGLEAGPRFSQVFAAGDSGYHTFRIPSVIATPKAPCSRSRKEEGLARAIRGTSTSSSNAAATAARRGRRCR